MDKFKNISLETMKENPFQLIGKDWMLIAAGNEDKTNAMTASWGGLGVMYGKNVAYVVIRPQRYTKKFVDQEDTFSLNFFDNTYRKTLEYMGTVSGKDEDKIAKSNLSLEKTKNTPYFKEANLVLICKKLFNQPLSVSGILDEDIKNRWYSKGDEHTLYIAEILEAMKK